MDLELLEKFFLEMAPPEAKNAIHSLFSKLKREPLAVTLRGLQDLYRYTHNANDPSHSVAINSLLIGVALGYAVRNSTEMQDTLNQYINHRQLEKGANIVDFSHARVGRKHP